MEATSSANLVSVLLPVIIGGGLALLGVALGPVITHWLTVRSTERDRRQARFEELMSLVHEHGLWLQIAYLKNAFGEERDLPPPPLSKAIALAALFFPQFLDQLRDLDIKSDTMILASMDAGQRRLRDGLTDGFADNVAEAHKPYTKADNALRRAMTSYAVARRGAV